MAKKEFQSPENHKQPQKRLHGTENGEDSGSLLSPRFRSAAAMAGWDEETLMLASMIVEDTPDREPKHKRRSHFKTPPATSRRRSKRSHQENSSPIPERIIKLDEDEDGGKEDDESKKNPRVVAIEDEKKEGDESLPKDEGVSSSIASLPCMDRLREELSCAICLEICFQPSTTTCGHSFCKKCLKFAADKCGKRCPKCRQLISNGRSCTVNTVLWNTIQLLFPDEIRERMNAQVSRGEAKQRSPRDRGDQTFNGNAESIIFSSHNARGTTREISENAGTTSSRQRNGSWQRIRRRGPSQEEDAALAFRLQREEFIEAYGSTHDSHLSRSLYSARSNLRAIASRTVDLRLRRRQPF